MAALIHDSEDKITDYANWYFVYVLELVIRVNFLKVSGVVLNQEAVDYALESSYHPHGFPSGKEGQIRWRYTAYPDRYRRWGCRA